MDIPSISMSIIVFPPILPKCASSRSKIQRITRPLSGYARRLPGVFHNSRTIEVQKKSRSSSAYHDSCTQRRPGWHYAEGCSSGRKSTGSSFFYNNVDPSCRPHGNTSVSKSTLFREMKGARASGLAVDGGVAAAPLAIAIRNLALSVKSDRGDVPVLKECSLNVPEGQFWMLLGPNGCGKSTLLKASLSIVACAPLMSLLRSVFSFAFHIAIKKFVHRDDLRELRATAVEAMAGLLRPNGGHMYVIGPRSFVFQNPDHQVVMPTAEADVAFGMGRFDLPNEEVRRRVQESLEAVGMAEYAQRSVQTLSGGQKQRIAIAGALAESSRLLLLDELTTYLDSADQIGVLEAVRKVVGGPQTVTALWVTHRLEELDYADGAAYMENGRVVLSGSVAEIRAHIRRQQEEFYKGQEIMR